MMRLHKRVHPNYVTGAIPVLPPMSNGIVFNDVIKGCVALTVGITADPDQPQTRVSGTLYTHPRFPGLILKKVTSRQELFRLGSSFIVGPKKSSANDGPVTCLIGSDAEAVLMGKRVGACSWNFGSAFIVDDTDGTAHRANFPPERFPEYPPVVMGTTYGSLTINGEWNASTRARDVMVQIPDAITSLDLDTPVSLTANGTIKYYDFTESRVFTGGSIGNYAIMAVLTGAEAGMLHAQSGVLPNGGGVEYVGWMASPVEIGNVVDVATRYRDAYLKGAPSKARKYLERAYASELESVRGVKLHVAYGTVFRMKPDIGGAGGFTERETGWVVPCFDKGASYGGDSYGVYTGSRPIDVTMRREIVPFDVGSMKPEVIAQMHCAHCWADARRQGKDLITRPYDRGLMIGAAKNPKALAALLREREIAYSAAYGETTLLNAAHAAGVTQDAGTPKEVRIPTLDAKFIASKQVYAQLGMDPYTYGYVREMREFYRRVAKRAEQLARADG